MLTFNDALAKRDLYDAKTVEASKMLNTLPKQSNGLLVAGVKNTPEYREFNDAYLIAVHNLKAINQFITRYYKKEYRQHLNDNRLAKRV